MSSIDPDPADVDLDTAETRIIIETNCRIEHEIEPGLKRGEQTFISEGTYRDEWYPEKSLINFDAYLDHDYAHECVGAKMCQVDGPDFYPGHSNLEIRMDAIRVEMRAAARKRAAEDFSHSVKVLAGWLAQSRKDHLNANIPGMLWACLRDEIEDDLVDEPDDWAVHFSGEVDDFTSWNEKDPITDVEEARLFSRGGWDYVDEAREDDDE